MMEVLINILRLSLDNVYIHQMLCILNILQFGQLDLTKAENNFKKKK